MRCISTGVSPVVTDSVLERQYKAGDAGSTDAANRCGIYYDAHNDASKHLLQKWRVNGDCFYSDGDAKRWNNSEQIWRGER